MSWRARALSSISDRGVSPTRVFQNGVTAGGVDCFDNEQREGGKASLEKSVEDGVHKVG